MDDDEYDSVIKTSLRFKGDKGRIQTNKSSPRANDESQLDQNTISNDRKLRLADADIHGGWWSVTDSVQIKDHAALEFRTRVYARAMDNGDIVLGKPHPEGEGPDEEEIFTALRSGTHLVAFKTGFARYISVDQRKHLVGLSEAVGEHEQFQPVFEDGRLALSANNDCFISPDDEYLEEDKKGTDCGYAPIVAKARIAGPSEILSIRVNREPFR